MSDFECIICALRALQDDVSPSLKSRIGQTISCLEKEGTPSLKLSKAASEIEELGNDSNLPSMTRTGLMQVLSIIETQR
jgi:uncharacterized protein (UPF0147 family)